MKEGGLMKKYTANVFVKDELKEITNREKDKPQRIIGEELKDYLFESEDTKVCILYGLRRTGKTTLMLQTISELTQDEFEKSAYIEVSNRDTISSLYSDLDRLKEEGYKYIFIDEVTSLDNFISMSSLFPDVYVRKGLRIVLTGTDSLLLVNFMTELDIFIQHIFLFMNLNICFLIKILMNSLNMVVL